MLATVRGLSRFDLSVIDLAAIWIIAIKEKGMHWNGCVAYLRGSL